MNPRIPITLTRTAILLRTLQATILPKMQAAMLLQTVTTNLMNTAIATTKTGYLTSGRDSK
ncbi:MAG: hypothetical protein RHS_2611 [Robinsoniella sp. RHS]|nr:MAG: hypothetical protein RHS_2611 [Robinsoniella sp. RHS]